MFDPETPEDQSYLEDDAAGGLAERLRDALRIEIEVADAETIAELERHEPGEPREAYAAAALKLGILALKTARGEIDAAAIKREGEQIVTGVRSVMAEQSGLIQSTLTQTLGEYFNPDGGKFHDRLDRLVRKDGELERLIADRLTGDESDLSRRLTNIVGEGSPLLTRLDPEAADGVIGTLSKAVNESLDGQRERIVRQFSLDDSDSALSRLLLEITDKNGRLKKELTESIEGVVKEFSLDDDASALSRMKKMVESTNEQIRSNLTLDDENSALFRLKREILELLGEHGKKQQSFEAAVKAELAALAGRKEEAEKSTRHGLEFEARVGEVLDDEASRLGDVCEATGNTTGIIRLSKVGDFVVSLGPDSASPGEKICFEAKEDDSYTLAKALAEIEVGRKNRSAGVGVFVFSESRAPASLQPISRHGTDVVVVWDPDGPTGDLILRLGYSLARALVAQRGRDSGQASFDFEAIEKSIAAVAKECERLERIDKSATSIGNQSVVIGEEVRKGRKALVREVGRLEEQLDAIKQLV